MKESLTIIEELKNNTELLIKTLNGLKFLNNELSNELSNAKKILKEKDDVIIKLKEKYHALEMGKAIVGSNDKNKTKRKIKKMINEIDDCIVKLIS